MLSQRGVLLCLNMSYNSSAIIYNIDIIHMSTVLSEVFYMALVTTAAGLIIKLAGMCYKSRCKEIKLCGGRISCIRDTEAEEKFDELELASRTLGNKSPSQKDLGSTEL